MRKAFFISQNSVRILLGIMLIVSAVMKILSLDTFVIYVYSFKILSFALTEIACRLLIALEMLMGAMLILKLRYKWVWWITMAMMVGFTLFLVYTAIFRNDSNCHCFGDIIEVDPVTSIFKNIGLIVALVLVYGRCERSLCVGWQKNEEGKEKFVFRLVADRDVFLTEEKYNKTAKICIYSIVGVAVFVSTFVLFPPTSIYNKIFSNNNLVATPVFDKAMTDSLVFMHYDDIQYNEQRDTVTFKVDTTYFNGAKGTYIVPVVSAYCKYCKQSCELMHDIFDRNNLPDNRLVVWVWGGNHQHCARFLRMSKTWEHDVYRISPTLAIDMVYGSFPTFLVVRDGKVIDAFTYRGVEERKIVKYVKEAE